MRFHCGFSFNWKTLKKWIIPILIGILLLFSQKLVVNAETFTQSNRFTWYTYTNSDTMVNSGTGQIPYSTNVLNRVQWLYQLYTYDPNYLYDITFTVKNKTFPGNDYNIYDFANACSISTGGGVQYQCYLNKSHSDYEDTISISILNFVGTNQNQLWLNIYSNSNKALYLETTSYSLQINRKENKNVTSDDLYNSTQNIIDNSNNNQNQTNQRLDEVNDNLEDIQDSVDDINSSITNPNINIGSSGSSFFGNDMFDKHYGLSGLITIPLNFIQGLISTTCTDLVLPLPFVNQDLTLPCISAIMSTNFQRVYDMYQLIIGGFIGLYCGLLIYKDVEDAVNPYKYMPVTQLFIG